MGAYIHGCIFSMGIQYSMNHVTAYFCCLQVVNGLMERKDWETAIKVPIGMLPTGSGNALVASTLDESG